MQKTSTALEDIRKSPQKCPTEDKWNICCTYTFINHKTWQHNSKKKKKKETMVLSKQCLFLDSNTSWFVSFITPSLYNNNQLIQSGDFLIPDDTWEMQGLQPWHKYTHPGLSQARPLPQPTDKTYVPQRANLSLPHEPTSARCQNDLLLAKAYCCAYNWLILGQLFS